jgi:hypothetical protein
VAQQDRLDVPAFGWRKGDVILQIHQLDLPSGPEGHEIAIGLYDPVTNTRLPVAVAGQPADDRLLLREVQP